MQPGHVLCREFESIRHRNPGKRGILRSVASWPACLHDQAHRMRLYHTPRHACLAESGQNLTLDSGAHLAHFPWLDDVRDQTLAYIACDSRAIARDVHTRLAPERRAISAPR